MRLTISIDNQLYELARAYAETRGMTLELLVAELLTHHVTEEFDRRKRLEKELREQVVGFSAGDRLTREQLHDRKLLRSLESGLKPHEELGSGFRRNDE